eukprot:1177234-Prorocentrum_minimum.AAC.3
MHYLLVPHALLLQWAGAPPRPLGPLKPPRRVQMIKYLGGELNSSVVEWLNKGLTAASSPSSGTCGPERGKTNGGRIEYFSG